MASAQTGDLVSALAQKNKLVETQQLRNVVTEVNQRVSVVLDTQATYKRDKVALKQKRASYKRARVACMIWAYPKIDELEIPQQAKKSL
jgi:pyridoxal/pyridoxine/pyridoxamine kinase